MLKRTYIALFACLLSCSLCIPASCLAGSISIGEALEIASNEAAVQDNISQETHFFIICVNATLEEMHDIESHGAIFVKQRQQLKEIIGNKNYAVVTFVNRKHFDTVVSYFVDLSTGEIFYVERTV